MSLFQLPIEAHERHIAVLGKTGSGKTYLARGEVESLYTRDKRVVVIDPTGVWWGLRLDQDGLTPRCGLVVIIGGDHGDLPLDHVAGEKLACYVAASSYSFVIDTSRLTVAARTRLFTDFAEGLARHNRHELHLVIDEAHLFMPQGRVPDPQSGRMVHASNHLVAAGRALGLRIILISQRPAKLHKDSLTQVETLVAMRLIAPQDRAAVEAWIATSADKARGRAIVDSLPSQPTGQGWVWAPELDVLQPIEVALIDTYDSMTAAGPGEPEPVLPPSTLNIAAIVDYLAPESAKTVGKARTDARAPAAAPVFTEQDLSDAYDRGRREGYLEGRRDASLDAVARIRAELDRWHKAPSAPEIPLPDSERQTLPARERATTTPIRESRPTVRSSSDHRPGATKANLSGALGLVVAAAKGGKRALTWAQIGTLAGRKPSGGHFHSSRKYALDSGFLAYAGERVVVTPLGLKEIGWDGESPTEDLAEAFLQALAERARKMYRALLERPGTADDLADRLSMQPRGGHWNSGLATLRRNDLIEIRDGWIIPAELP